VLLPVYNTPGYLLRKSLDSVLRQTYSHWELCIADDRSTEAHVRDLLLQFNAQDPRIRLVWRPTNGGISAASNSCLAIARGEIAVLLDHDDELAPEALAEIAEALRLHPDVDMLYSDEDKIDVEGSRFDPFFKPDWSPEYLLGCMYVGHVGAYRTSLLRELGGFRSEVDGAQDYDLALRVTSRTARVHHVPKVLYHWRALEDSTASGIGAKDYAYAAAESSLRHFLEINQFPGRVLQGAGYGAYRVQLDMRGEPSVRILVACIRALPCEKAVRESILERTDWKRVEVELVERNGLVGHAGGEEEYLVILDERVRVVSPDWIERLLEYCQQSGVGAVGPRLVDGNGRIQSAGVVFAGGRLCHAYQGDHKDHPGHFLSAQLSRNYLAVSGACLMTPAPAWVAAGGFQSGLTPHLRAIDYCLRLREHQGLRTVFTPYAEMEYDGPNFAPSAADVGFESRWRKYREQDPYYNPNLPREYPYHPPVRL
jgi:GT2 family glycosyltransferase